MEEKKNNRPSAERILSLLVELLADQHAVKVKYQIIKKEGENFERPAKGAERALASMEGGVAV